MLLIVARALANAAEADNDDGDEEQEPTAATRTSRIGTNNVDLTEATVAVRLRPRPCPRSLVDRLPRGCFPVTAPTLARNQSPVIPPAVGSGSSETRVLLVDDEEGVIDVFGPAMELEGFDVTTANSGAAAIHAFHTRVPDVVILDLRLPDVSGLEVCREIRARSRVPILVISGEAEEARIIRLLEAGADGYLVKPFGVAELVARVRAAIRRGPRPDASSGDSSAELGGLRLGMVRLEVGRRQAWVGEQLLDLRPREFDLLEVLMRNSERVVSRSTLLAEVWPMDSADGARAIDGAVRRLRRSLAGSGTRIAAVRGLGFRLEPSE